MNLIEHEAQTNAVRQANRSSDFSVKHACHRTRQVRLVQTIQVLRVCDEGSAFIRAGDDAAIGTLRSHASGRIASEQRSNDALCGV